MTAPCQGDRVRLVDVPPSYEKFGVAAGTLGTVEMVDSLATVHIRWDTGQRFGVITAARDMIRMAPPPDDPVRS